MEKLQQKPAHIFYFSKQFELVQFLTVLYSLMHLLHNNNINNDEVLLSMALIDKYKPEWEGATK